MSEEDRLEHQMEIADARLGVAEDMGFWLAILLAVLVYREWGSWLATIAVGVVGYFGATYEYRREDKLAEDAYVEVSKREPIN